LIHNIGDHDNNVNMRIDSLGVLSWCVEIGYRVWDEERTRQEIEKAEYKANAWARHQGRIHIVLPKHL
jgi:hypothetical protein